MCFLYNREVFQSYYYINGLNRSLQYEFYAQTRYGLKILKKIRYY